MKKYIALGLLVGSFCTQMYGASREVRAGATLAGFLKQPHHESVEIEDNNQKVDSTAILINFNFHLGHLNRIFFLNLHREGMSLEAANRAKEKFIQTKTVPALLYACMMGKHALPSGTVLRLGGTRWKVEDHGTDSRTLTLQEE